ncbi:DUF5677 domain-containing protein [Pedobacter agri]|uniref:DUF5677 domain-containing protein n=1 Tax=Pedobacter agri TaxID=454586 RepID=UPI00292D316E|nr:DUF5677 domain-containing protein [Pedobacter agri]
MIELNNRNNISPFSGDILDIIFKMAQEYADNMASIGNSFDATIEGELKTIVLPYLIAMYGKMITAYRLLNGYSLQDLHPSMPGVSNDPIVLYDLVRSMYECFLQSHFIINRYPTSADKKYIILWWGCRALTERGMLAATSKLENDQLRREADFIAANTAEIVKNHAGRLQTDRDEFGFRKNEQLANWPKPGKLCRHTGIHHSHHDYLYKISSLYAHAEPFAIMQVRCIYKYSIDHLDEGIRTHGRDIVNLGLIALDNFSQVFPEIRRRIGHSPGLPEMINKAKAYYSLSRAAISNRE